MKREIPLRKMTGRNKLSITHGLAYASPILITSFLLYPVQMLLAGIYAKHFGLALTTIAAVVFSARLFDAFTDPLIGYLSDRYRVKTGSRKLWIIVGALGLVISSYLLYSPPTPVSAIYFLIVYLSFYLFWTIIDIPHMAWGGELTSCSQDKTRVYSLRTQAIFIGAFLFTIAPMLPFFGGEGFTPETLRWSVLASAIVVVPLLILCVKNTPNGRKSISPKKESFSLICTAIIENRPLLNLLSGFFLINIGYGLYISLTFIFADAYLGVGRQLPIIFAFSVLVGLGGAIMVYRLAAYYEKVTIYGLSVVITGLALLGHAFLGPETTVLLFTMMTSLVYFGNSIILIISLSLLSDIADYGTLKFGVDRAATYFSMHFFATKALGGFGGALGLALIGWYEFDASAITNSEKSVFGLRLAIGYLPALLMISALAIIIKTPISARRHFIIQKRLSQRISRDEKRSLTISKTTATSS